mmetsp:Transcript_38506/g.63087  ORF Transcript_38506/g.63087 Transcript_38506/m.63087 type:complete len:219 (-) Transcript_38506:91-747(-)
MVNVKSKKCEFKGCEVQPNFNYKGEVRARFCAVHKVNSMLDVKHKKRCENKGCTKRPLFNHKEKGAGQFCAQHKQKGITVVKRCDHSSGPYDRPPLAGTEMIVNPGKRNQHEKEGERCHHNDCLETPHFNFYSFGRKQKEKKYCEEHRMEGMVDLREIVDIKDEEISEGEESKKLGLEDEVVLEGEETKPMSMEKALVKVTKYGAQMKCGEEVLSIMF